MLLALIVLFSITSNAQIDSKGCKKLKRSVDKMTGVINISTPANIANWMRVVKYIEEGIPRTYLSLRTVGSTLNVGEKGVIVLLEDGTKLEWPNEKVDAEASESVMWHYSAFINLTDEEIETLSKSPIEQYRLYIYDGEPRTKLRETIQQQLGCIRDIN